MHVGAIIMFYAILDFNGRALGTKRIRVGSWKICLWLSLSPRVDDGTNLGVSSLGDCWYGFVDRSTKWDPQSRTVEGACARLTLL